MLVARLPLGTSYRNLPFSDLYQSIKVEGFFNSYVNCVIPCMDNIIAG